MDSEIVGQLGIIDIQGYPRIIPINFVEFKGNIYFHGAREGEKFSIFSGSKQNKLEDPKVTFSVYKAYSFLPSYFMSDIACAATIFFKSVHIRGRGSLVTDLNEKIDIIISLMEKHQPEKKYIEIDIANKKYLSFLKTTGIFKIKPKEITMKQKFGQNMGDSIINHIIEQLQKRNSKIDQETIIEIQKRRKN